MMAKKSENKKSDENKNETYRTAKRASDYVAIVAVIVAIVIFALQVSFQLYQQRITQLQELINNLKSLDYEFQDNLYVMNNYTSLNLTGKNYFGILVTENLKRSATDGTITSQTIKKSIISILFDLEEINNRILFVNSPEFNTLILTNSTQYSNAVNTYNLETVNNIKIETPKVIFVDNQVNEYTSCLQIKLEYYDSFWTFRFFNFDYSDCLGNSSIGYCGT